MNDRVGTGDYAMIRYDCTVQTEEERYFTLHTGSVVCVMGCTQDRDWDYFVVSLLPIVPYGPRYEVHQNYMRPLRSLELLALQAVE